MGSTKFDQKRLAFVIAPLVIKQGGSEPLMNLLPNIFRKDLKQMAEPWTVSVSVTCFSRLCTEDMANLLSRDLLPLFTCSKSDIRKKVCILSHKIFIHSPDCFTELQSYLCDRLKDSKMGVQISAVTAIHEITRLNPRLFLVTVPTLFQLFSSTKSNWLIIKLIKLVSNSRTNSHSLSSCFRWSRGCMPS